jgi:hypothetical protein
MQLIGNDEIWAMGCTFEKSKLDVNKPTKSENLSLIN